MKQSRLMSAAETFISTAAGFGLSLLLQWLVLPILLGHPVPISVNLAFAAVMTVASLARQYLLRRLFEALHIRRPLSPFMQAVIAERYRQIEVEGWDAAHDDAHRSGEMAVAGAAYAKQAPIHLSDDGWDGSFYAQQPRHYLPNWWPWHISWWKPVGFRRDLVKAAALIVAEGEKFDRNRKPARGAA